MNRSKLRQIIKEEIKNLNESTIKSTDDFIIQLTDTIKKHFPKSFLRVVYENNLTPHISIMFSVGRRSDWINGIFQNDLSPTNMMIFDLNEDGTLTDHLDFDPHLAGSFIVKPPKNSYLAYGRVKVPVRRKHGKSENILKSVDKYFSDLKKSIKSNIKKIPYDHLEYVKKAI